MTRVGGTLCPVSTEATHVAIIELDSLSASGMVCFGSGLCVWPSRRFVFVVFSFLFFSVVVCVSVWRPCAPTRARVGLLGRLSVSVCPSLSLSGSCLFPFSFSLPLSFFSCACVWRSL